MRNAKVLDMGNDGPCNILLSTSRADKGRYTLSSIRYMKHVDPVERTGIDNCDFLAGVLFYGDSSQNEEASTGVKFLGKTM